MVRPEPAKVPAAMVSPSPAPRRVGPRWIKVAAWSGVGVLVLVLLAGVALATAPRWAKGMVKRELEQRLARRLDLEVEIGELELSWRDASLEDIELRGEELELSLDEVEVALDREALWSARFEVTEVAARGGQLRASRGAIERLADRVRDLDADEESRGGHWLRRRTRLTPEAIELRELGFSLREGEARQVTGKLAASVEPSERRVDLRLTSVAAELGLGRPLRAGSLHALIEADDAGGLRFPLAIDLRGGATRIDENIAVAGVHGEIVLLDEHARELRVELSGGFDDEDAGSTNPEETTDLWSINGRFARDLSAGRIALDMQSFELGRVPQVLEGLPVVDSERATIGGHVELAFGGGVADIDGTLALAGLNVSHRLLAREVVRDIGLTVEVDARLDPAARRLELERLELARNGVRLVARGELNHPIEREARRYRLALEVPEVGCQQVLDAIPRELIPGLQGFELAGEFEANVRFEADFANLDALVLDGEVGLDRCKVRATPPLADSERLRGGFTHRVVMRDGRTRTLQLYPGSGSFTPLAGISRYMVEAVLTTEDGSFRRHEGFNTNQLEVALRRNLEEGKVRLGASTITMQMVKNVLLSHERTLSRKLQELFLTWWVEEALSKQRIMELYLNVIEFGPGVYGITNAARHYFGKHPSELTSLEAAFLALMLPSPVRRHEHYCKGELDERFIAKLHLIHGLMRERGRISDEEFAAYEIQPIVLDPIERGDPEACVAEIEALMAATEIQRALTGLLGDGEGSAWLEASVQWATPANDVGASWGVVPPLPGELPWAEPGAVEGETSSWRVPDGPIDRDPSNSDAPGSPAMEDPA